MKQKKETIMMIVGILILIVTIAGISYAAVSYTRTGEKVNSITTGVISMSYEESSNVIAVDKALPTTDKTGKIRLKEGEYFDFTITSIIQGSAAVNFEIAAKEEDGNTIDGKYIKYYLTKVDSSGKETEVMAPRTYYEDKNANSYTGRPANMMSLYTGSIGENTKETIKYRLRIYVTDTYNPQGDGGGLVYKTRVNVYGLSSKDEDKYCYQNGFTKLSDCMLVMNGHEKSVEEAKTAIAAKGAPNFSKVAPNDSEEDGLYKSEDDDGDSYYYRGAVNNNYVSFAGFIWRIIRRNGDGSIRMIYSGKTTSDAGDATMIGYSQYNSKYFDPTYVGYQYSEDLSLHENNSTTGYVWFTNTKKYNFGTGYTFDAATRKFTLTGTISQLTWKDNHDEIVNQNLYSCLETSCNVMYKVTGYINDTQMKVQPISYSSNSYEGTLKNTTDSVIKTKIDSWYESNLLNKEDEVGKKYSDYLADVTFCNDRSIASGSGYLTTPTTLYEAYKRLANHRTPSLKCSQNSDQFRVNNAAAALKYPISLITADEIALAGGVYYTTNSNYYLYNGKYYWTLSPSYFASNDSMAFVWLVTTSGSLYPWNYVTASDGVRPVLNLSSNVQITMGDGTSSNPFIVSIS